MARQAGCVSRCEENRGVEEKKGQTRFWKSHFTARTVNRLATKQDTVTWRTEGSVQQSRAERGRDQSHFAPPATPRTALPHATLQVGSILLRMRHRAANHSHGRYDGRLAESPTGIHVAEEPFSNLTTTSVPNRADLGRVEFSQDATIFCDGLTDDSSPTSWSHVRGASRSHLHRIRLAHAESVPRLWRACRSGGTQVIFFV